MITYALNFKYSNFFSHYGRWYYSLAALTSVFNWLPVLLSKHFDVNLRILSCILTYAQNAVLAISVMRLARAMRASMPVAWLVVVLFVYAYPHDANFASYWNIRWQPYPAEMAIAMILLSASYLLEGRKRPAMWFLVISAMIHAVLTLQGLTIFLIFHVLRRRAGDHGAGSALTFLGYGLVACIATLPVIALHWFFPEGVISGEVRQALLKNLHVSPDPQFLKDSALYIGFLSVPVFAALRARPSSDRTRLLWFSAALGCLLMTGLHWVAVRFQFLALARLIGSRSSQLFVLFTFPIAVASIEERLERGDWWSTYVFLFFLLLLHPFQATMEMRAGILLSFVLLEAGRGGSWPKAAIVFRRAGQVSLVALTLWVSAAFVRGWASFPLSSLYSAPLIPFVGMAIALFLTVGPSIATRLLDKVKVFSLREGGIRTMVVSLIAVFGWMALQEAKGIGYRFTQGEFVSMHQLQSWVRKHTSPHTAFLLLDNSFQSGWTTLSERPRMERAGHFYFLPRAAQDYNERYSRLVQSLDRHNGKIDEGLYRTLTGPPWNVEYVVARRGKLTTSFPIAFETPHFLLFRIQ